MQAEQQILSNEQLHKMSVELLKETLDLDEFEFQQFQGDIKFEAYVRSIQKIGIVLSTYYQKCINDRQDEIVRLRVLNQDFQYKLTQEMEQNWKLNFQIQDFQNKHAQVFEKLDKSEHEIEYKKHEIQNQINANELLLRENEKLKIRNDQLMQQNNNLQLEIEDLMKKNEEHILQNQCLKFQKIKYQAEIKRLKQDYDRLKEDHDILEKELEGALILIEEKDFLIGNRISQEGDPIDFSAHQHYPYFNSTIRIVRQQNQSAGSDKEVMKGIESGAFIDPIMALKFNESRSISRQSQKSQTSLYIIENVILDDIVEQEKETSELQSNRKLLKTERKRKDSNGSIQKQTQNKSCNKLQKRKKQTSIPKVPLPYPSPKQNEKQKEIPITQKKKQQLDEKLDLENIRNASEQNHTKINKIKNKKLRSNASVILKNPVSRLFGDEQRIIKRSRIEHSQSVQDFYRDDTSQYMEKDQIERELYTKQKLIESLKFENRSVRQMVLEESQKRTEAEHEYEESIQKLKSEVEYFRTQMREIYVKYVQQKAFSDTLQKELIEVSDLIQTNSQEYENAKKELKIKCKQLIEDEIRYYQERYEEMQEKMKSMELNYLNGKRDLDEIGLDIQNEQNPKELKKCKSNSLFYKQVKHHSYNASQQYSDINHLSANHSKNTSFIHIDQEEGSQVKYTYNNTMLIEDYGENQMEEIEQNFQELQSYQRENQSCEQEIQTDIVWIEEDSYKVSLDYSKMQEVHDSSEISYQFSSLGLKSSEDHSKIRSLLEEKFQKIKKFSICSYGSITIESEKMGVSDFDTVYEISPRTANESSCITADLSTQFSKLKLGLNLLIEEVFSLNINQPKQKKIEQTIQTLIPQFSFFKGESIEVQPFKNISKYSQHLIVSEFVLPKRKSFKDREIQKDNDFLSNFQTQTTLIEVQSIQIQSTPQLQSAHSQTEREIFRHTQILSMTCLPTQKETQQLETQYERIQREFSTQTLSKRFDCISLFSSKFEPSPKKLKSTSIQTLKSYLNFDSPVLSETIHATETIKNDHNQSFNEEYINEVLTDMSQSFQISEHFIETLKKKLLQINQNLKKLEQQKQDDSSISSNGVEKIFKSIDMEIDSNHEKILSSVTVIPKFRSDFFEGNVQTSKASTNCSLSTSVSFQSPHRHESEEEKLKVTNFQEILEIQSENVESFTRNEVQNLENHNYEHSSCAGSVNKSPEQQNIILEAAQVEDFISLNENQAKFGSGKKYEVGHKKLSLLLNSPKNHLIQKQKISSPINSPKNKPIKAKVGKFQKPEELQEISQQDFDFICRRYKTKKMKLVKRKESERKDESTDLSEQSMYHNLSSRELMIVFCRQKSLKNATQNHEIIVLHESRVISLTYNYEFQTQKVIVSTSGDKLIFGNQEITLTETQLNFWLKNKMNHFNCIFPSWMAPQQVDSIKSKDMQVMKMLKLKFK